MSIDLKLRYPRPLPIIEILRSVGRPFKDLLRLSFEPEIIGDESYRGKCRPIDGELLDESLEGFLRVRLKGEPDAVYVFVYKGQTSLDPEETILANVNMAGNRTPLATALGCAVAIALARESGTDVRDPSAFFITTGTHVRSLPPEQFLETIRVSREFDNYHDASAQFYEERRRAREADEASPWV